MKLATFLPEGTSEPLAGEVRGDEVVAFAHGTVLDRLASGDRTPAVHDLIAIDQIEVDKDGNPTGATPAPNLVTWANTSFFPLTSVIGSMTVGSILRVWYPPSFGKRIVEYRFKRYVFDSSDSNQQSQ